MTDNWLEEVMEQASQEIKKWPEEFTRETRKYYESELSTDTTDSDSLVDLTRFD